MSVCVGVITSGSVQAETVESLIGLVCTKAAAWVLLHRTGPYLDDARNELVRKFDQEPFTECDRLLMVDSDIEFAPDDVRRLAEDDLPIVSGVYHSDYGGRVLPVVYDWCEVDGRRTMAPAGAWPDGALDDDYADRPLTPVTGVGAGFLMVRRDALDALQAAHGEPVPWFAEEIHGGVHFGEDLTFCIRAAQLGIPIHVDRRVQVAHHKHIRIGGRPGSRNACP